MYPFHFVLAVAVAFISFTLAANTTAAIGTNCNIVANHTVVSGDGLANIATAANTTLDQVRFVNPQITNPRLINVGDVIAIPDSACVAPTNPPLAEPITTCSNGTESTTKVVAGDNLIIIAKEKLGITLSALIAANPQITNPDKINVGDVINVPLCSNSTNGTTKGSKKEAGKRAVIILEG
jgi:LysM repeat protein